MKKNDIREITTIASYTILQETRGKQTNSKKPSHRMFFSMLFLYLFSGASIGPIVSAMTNSFSASFLSASAFMVLIINFILIEFPSLVTGPEDFAFYSHLPVKSGTYFLAKIAAIGFFILSFSIVFSIPIVIIHLIAHRNIAIVLGIGYAIVTSGIIGGLIVINLFGVVVRYVPMKAIQAVSTTLQFIIIFALYGFMFLFSRSIRSSASILSVSFDPLLLVIPSAWSPSIFAFNRGLPAILAFLLSIVSIPILVFASYRIVSIDFAEKLAGLETKTTVARTRKKGVFSFLLRTDEEKAVGILLVNHLKYDNQFKLAILTIIPLSAVYFIMVFVNSASKIFDPFTFLGKYTFASTIPLYVAIGFFPFYIKSALSFSSNADASWIFFSAPFDRIRLIDATHKFIVAFFFLPFFLVFVVVYIAVTGIVVNILLHFLVVFLLAMIQIDLFIYFLAEIPFSRKYQRGRRIITLYLRMFMGFLLPVPLYIFVYFIYGNRIAFAGLVAILLIVSLIVRKAGKRVALRRLNREEYQYGN
jgi:hypothetical protein